MIEPPPPQGTPCLAPMGSKPPPPPHSPLLLAQCLPPPMPPSEPPTLALPEVATPVPAPRLSPALTLTPGGLSRSLALACMDEDAEADEARTASLGDGDELDTRTADAKGLVKSGLLGPPSPQISRVTLELSKAVLLPSLGSSAHATGQCTPCAWFWKPQGCGNEKECSYCHMCPEGEIRRRRKMKNAALRAKAASGPTEETQVLGLLVGPCAEPQQLEMPPPLLL